jgi:hypothetical protein
LASIAVALLLGSIAHAAETYKVDPAHTSVTFSVRHLGINSVKGKFKEFEGALVLDGDTLKEASGRTTTGSRLTYTSADDRYVVVGTPARVVEACGRDTSGNSLTLSKVNDRIEVTGYAGVRAATAGTGSNCGP